jgi:hypothetical protein
VHLLPGQDIVHPSHPGRHTVSHTRNNTHTCREDKQVPDAVCPGPIKCFSTFEWPHMTPRTLRRRKCVASSIVSGVKIDFAVRDSLGASSSKAEPKGRSASACICARKRDCIVPWLESCFDRAIGCSASASIRPSGNVSGFSGLSQSTLN